MAEAPETCQHLVSLWMRLRYMHTRVAPGQELREEGVVVCQRLAGGRCVAGGVAGSGQVRHLGRRLCGLIHDVLGYRTWRNPVSISKGRIGMGWDKHTIGDGVVGTCGICGGSYRQLVRARKDRKWWSSCETLEQLARCRQQRRKIRVGTGEHKPYWLWQHPRWDGRW
jgi:hypothetical protein